MGDDTRPGAGMSWADCLAAIKAGERPASFVASGAEPLNPPPELPSLEVPATAHLYQKIEGPVPRTFQLVYLRPPFTLWDYVESGDKGGLDTSDVFDNELDLDVLGMFRPRFVDPPEFLLEKAKGAVDSTDSGPVEYNDDADVQEEEIEPRFSFPSETRRGAAASSCADIEQNVEFDLDGIATAICNYLSHERSPLDEVGEKVGESVLPDTLRVVSCFEWSLVYARLKEIMVLRPSEVVRLLRAVDTQALAEMVLFSALDDLSTACDEDPEEASAFDDLARVAARCCVTGGWTSSRLRQYIKAGLLSGEGIHSSSALLSVCLSLSDVL